MSEQQNGKQGMKDAGTAVAVAEKPALSLLEVSIEQGEKYLAAFDKIRKIAIRLTNHTDWIDQNGTPYLESAGCAKIASAFGVVTSGTMAREDTRKDENGDYIRFVVTGKGRWHTAEAEEMGSASTRDDFFARRKNRQTGEYYMLPLAEVDLGDVEKKAYTNFMNRLIKRLIGLSFTWEDLATYSGGAITKEKCTGVSYGPKGSKGGSTTAAASAATTGDRALIWKQLLDINDGESEHAATQLEKLTAYTYKGAPVPGKRDINKVSDKGIVFLKNTVARLHAEWENMAGAGQGGDEPPPQDDPNA